MYLKGGVDDFSYFSIDFQLFYFLTKIIPDMNMTPSGIEFDLIHNRSEKEKQ